MPNSVTNRQMFFIIFITLTSYTTIDLPKIMAQAAGRSSWIPLLIAAILFGFVAMVTTKLNNMYQGKVFFVYSQEIVGKFFAYLLAVYFIFYFVIIGIYLKLKLVSVLKSNFLPNTPRFVMLIFSVLLFAYVAYKGITNIARLFEIYGILFLLITIGICFLMLFQGMSENILPLYNPNDANEFLGASQYFVLPYGGIEILLIIPFTPINKNAPKIAFLTLIFIGLFYVLIVESTLMTFGLNNTIALKDSFIEAIKLVEAPVIERLDIFYVTFGLTSLFAGMIVVFTAIVEFTCRIFSKVKRIIIVISIGIIVFILSLLALQMQNMEDVFDAIVTCLVLVSCVIIPTTLFIMAKIKNKADNQSS